MSAAEDELLEVCPKCDDAHHFYRPRIGDYYCRTCKTHFEEPLEREPRGHRKGGRSEMIRALEEMSVDEFDRKVLNRGGRS